MAHHHDHHHHHSDSSDPLPPALDATVPDAALTPEQLSRRTMLRSAGLLGAGLAAGGVLGAAGTAAASDSAKNSPTSERASGKGRLLWLAGDHHIHTQYSSDAKYRVIDQVRQGNSHGLDWMVITDHGSVTHAKIGVDKVNPDIVAARKEVTDTLIFQGLEWNIPGAEHGTVFVHPGKSEVAVLKEFENSFDGVVKGATASTSANEALAIAGLNFLSASVTSRKVQDALMLANHPARRGLNSPHEMRAWRDAKKGIAVGMEGAPGHQAAGLPTPHGPASARGSYDYSASADSFAAYPAKSYVTFGGFDWMTATVGGLWDSLLAEGKPWWITANSDSHNVYTDAAKRGGPDSDFDQQGYYTDPVYAGDIDLTANDFWPGQYSRTHVGAYGFNYQAVMDGIRGGRVWVDHGGLIAGLDVRVTAGGRDATLGGVLHTRRGAKVELVIDVALASLPNWAQFVPKLARVDVIQGDVTGKVSDQDTFTAPKAKVVKSFEVTKSSGIVRFSYSLGSLDRPVYLRLRGTDGNRVAVGLNGAAVDPAGPAEDVLGDADPWQDLWFYANPIWVLPA